MDYYREVVLPNCDSGIFLPFEDGMFGAGVFGEAEELYRHRKPIWEITQEGIIYPLPVLDRMKRLSIAETRKRVYGTN